MAQHRASAPSRRVAIIAADAGRLLRLRAPLLRAIVRDGHKLLCLTGSAGKADIPALAEIGAEHDAFPLHGARLRTLGDRRSVEALRVRLAHWRPNVIVGIGLKPLMLTARAAARMPEARLVLLAPSLAEMARPAGRSPGFAARWLAQRAMKSANAVVVHNTSDEALLRDAGVVPADTAIHVLPGAGVDLAHFAPTPLPALERGLVFTFVSFREREKGLVEFCEAARRVKAKAPGARFVLATTPRDGPPSPARTAIDIGDLRRFDDCVELDLAPTDVRALIGQCHVFVLPSYAEGLAHEVVEALACGRPAITTNVAGCRETVDERVSGVLVPPRDPIALASAMESFLRRPDLIAWMAQASRHKAERRFDAREINAQLLRLMGLGRDGGP